MVIGVPTGPLFGDTVLITGGSAAVTVKADVTGLKPVTVTTTPPTDAAVAVAGTLVLITVPLLLAITAAIPPTVTLAPLKLLPLMVRAVPAGPEIGNTELTVGCAGGENTENARLSAA
jgi:hypothetical protein